MWWRWRWLGLVVSQCTQWGGIQLNSELWPAAQHTTPSGIVYLVSPPSHLKRSWSHQLSASTGCGGSHVVYLGERTNLKIDHYKSCIQFLNQVETLSGKCTSQVNLINFHIFRSYLYILISHITVYLKMIKLAQRTTQSVLRENISLAEILWTYNTLIFAFRIQLQSLCIPSHLIEIIWS